jgi:DNA-binding MarR family transcriptional regulator
MQPFLATALHEVVGLLDRSGGRILQQESGVSFRQFYLVSALARLGPCTQRELAGFVGHSDAAVSRMLVTLAASGLVSIEVDPADRRRRTVSLTPSGTALAASSDALLDTRLTELLGAYEIDGEMLLRLVGQLREALQVESERSRAAPIAAAG